MSPPGGAAPGFLDTQGIWPATMGLPEQVERAAEAAASVDGLPDRDEIENVVVLGMGGSGIAGDILLATAGPFMAVPVVVVKSYTLPAFVGEGSLVFAISFSGDTEETVEAAGEAAVQGARVVAVTSGGQLEKLATSWGSPVVNVPADLPQPRTAIGAMAIPPLVMLEEVGLFPGAVQWIDLAVEQLKRRRDQLVAGGGPSAEIARRIGRTIPLMHSSGAMGNAAAQRWKTQVNEIAKAPAFWAVYPELCHNELQGWGQHGDVTRQLVTIVNLRHDSEHPQVSRRFDLVGDLVREAVAGIEEVQAEGDGDLAQLLDLVLVGDFVALHMAGNEGIDPGPVPIIDELKHELQEG
ncbi:MAG TPA: bifunctional phosphoglucose/phosphomannose isomerase [Acidimicrobiales bacterium]|nr:bifunctional phosphoglucose/phosphomannose isomerase [Acidimicrobiales bacterium]